MRKMLADVTNNDDLMLNMSRENTLALELNNDRSYIASQHAPHTRIQRHGLEHGLLLCQRHQQMG